MATKALTYGAQRVSLGRVSSKRSPGHGPGWRAVFSSQDAAVIWQKLYILIRSTVADDQLDYFQKTQELLLTLLATERLNAYVAQGLSDEEIQADLISLILE